MKPTSPKSANFYDIAFYLLDSHSQKSVGWYKMDLFSSLNSVQNIPPRNLKRRRFILPRPGRFAPCNILSLNVIHNLTRLTFEPQVTLPFHATLLGVRIQATVDLKASRNRGTFFPAFQFVWNFYGPFFKCKNITVRAFIGDESY